MKKWRLQLAAVLCLILAGHAQAAPPTAELAKPLVHSIEGAIERTFRPKPPPPLERPRGFRFTQPGDNVIIKGGAVTTVGDVAKPVGDRAAQQCASPSIEYADRNRCQEMIGK
jgi:hypothetical protein